MEPQRHVNFIPLRGALDREKIPLEAGARGRKVGRIAAVG